MKKLLILILMSVMATSAIFAQKNTVAVVPFDHKGVSADDAETLTELFTSEYAAATNVTVVDRVNFDKIVAQMKFELTDWSNNEKVAEQGKALNANLVLCGQVRTLGNKITLNVRVINVNSTAIVSSVTGSSTEITGFLDEMPVMVNKMAMKPTSRIGETGPGGGIIFYIEGSRGLEVSPWLGEYNWEDAMDVAKNYKGGGYDDWYLPNKGELNLIYQNLVKTGIIDVSQGDIWHWSSSQYYNSYVAWYQSFSDGYQFSSNDSKDYTYSVRAVRAF